MMASAIVMVRHLSSSLIFIRLNARRLNTARRFSSPRALPLGLPLRPFRKRVAFGGFPYPTSEGSSDDFSKLLFFMKYSFAQVHWSRGRPKFRLNVSYSSGVILLCS